MKTLKLKKRDAFDLHLVLNSILNEDSDKMEFKEIIGLQKASALVKSAVKDFSDKHDEFQERKNELMKLGQKRINSFKEQKIAAARESKSAEGYKAEIDAFAAMELDSVKTQIAEDIRPEIDALYEGIGEEDVSIEFEDEKLKVVVDNFEKHANTKYTNKSRMTEVYDALVSAQA